MALDIIFTDTEQSKNTKENQLEAAIQSATTGDQVFIYSINRLGMNKMNALRRATDFTKKGASVTFVKEGLVFTEQDEPISMLIKTLLVKINPAKLVSAKKELRPRVTAKKTKATVVV